MVADSKDITQIFNRINEGDSGSTDQLIQMLYSELRSLAANRLAGEVPGNTLQATALVHEVYLRLLGGSSDVQWNNRGHFFGAAALAMRRILVERARKKAKSKHNISLDNMSTSFIYDPRDEPVDNPVDLVELDAALDKLGKQDQRLCDVVMLRYFAGLSLKQVSQVQNLSLATIKRDWVYARAWLHSEVGK